MAIPPVSLWNVEHGWTGVNPGMTYQFLAPDGTARLADYVKAGWNRADVEDYLQRLSRYLHRAYYAALPAHPRHARILVGVGHRDRGGDGRTQDGPAEALGAVAATWEKITDRLGRPGSSSSCIQQAIGYRPS